MGRRDTLVAEFGAAVGVVGLLLVFLPLFLERIVAAGRAAASMRELRVRMLQSWLVPLTIGLAAASATTGLLTLWGTADLAWATAVLVLIATWLVVGLAVVAVATVW